MMNAVDRRPEYRPAFQRQSSANREKVLHPGGDFVGAMGVEAMVSHADSQSGGYPVQEDGRGKRMPIEEEKRSYGADVEERENKSGGPVQALPVDGRFVGHWGILGG